MSNLLKVNSIEIREDKKGNPYKFIEVANYPHKLMLGPDGTQVKVRQMARTIGITAWDKREVTMEDGTKYDFKADPSFALEDKESFAGDIVTRKVPAYDIADDNGEVRTVDTYSCVVFGDTDDKPGFEAAISKEFKRRDHDLNADATVDSREEMTPAAATLEPAPAKTVKS